MQKAAAWRRACSAAQLLRKGKPRWRPSPLLLLLLQLFKEGLGLEVLGDEVVQPSNDLVDLFLPAGVHVASRQHGFEKLAQGLFDHPAEAVGNLWGKKETCKLDRGRKEDRIVDGEGIY